MTISKLDIQDAWMAGSMEADTWIEECELEYDFPMLELNLAMAWNTMPDEAKALAKDIDPEAYEDLEKKYGGKDAPNTK